MFVTYIIVTLVGRDVRVRRMREVGRLGLVHTLDVVPQCATLAEGARAGRAGVRRCAAVCCGMRSQFVSLSETGAADGAGVWSLARVLQSVPHQARAQPELGAALRALVRELFAVSLQMHV